MSRAIILRSLLFALLWWVLVEGRADSWGLGVLAVFAALWASLRLLPPGSRRISLAGLLGYLTFFVWNSARGGAQVSWMALRGRQTLQPAILEWKLGLPPGAPSVLLLNTLGLMPGTLGVELRDDRLRIHVVDERLPILAEVEVLEAHIARMFGVSQ
ncbi:multicomponent Na+:H+ antiporter subunit E [Geopseudomonas sagittaria]|uniref:Multicomponent Na+:H+ antiporter subunit E n=1 Tax=Geopseudomonas sagittaria TaxID=1135990 RepID=A0A1I5W735_9GAMM|nr:Na+/H+ antiporter subunit E [Pseudomonas sagittaria]SFQ15471.1 multicomponent Na+:H+ antiporter subunit E [Pseudomonas sagittaria]